MAVNRPRFIQAETVMPTVSYRPQTAPAAAPLPPAPVVRHAAPPPVAPVAPVAPVRVVPRVEIAEEMSIVERMPVTPRMAPPPAHHVPLADPAPGASLLPARRGELTVVFGCRGGSGATTLAVNTAALIARQGRTSCIVDLDLQLGDVCTALDLEPQTSLSAVAREAHLLDAVSLRRRLAQHGSGVCALAQTGHLDDLDPQLAARMPNVLDTLRTHFDHVVVDGVRDFGDLALAAIEAATRIVLVITQDVASVRRAARVLDVMKRLGGEATCSVVINRAVRRAAIDDAAIERALGVRIAGHVREDARVAESLDTGALLVDVAATRPIVGDLHHIASLCRPSDPTASTRRAPRRWFHLFRGGH